jgi:hypothetical protein
VLHPEIIAAVVASARRNDERSEMRMFTRPRRAPRVAGKRNGNKHTLERASKGCMHIKNAAGIN